jgi:hypothetical protein
VKRTGRVFESVTAFQSLFEAVNRANTQALRFMYNLEAPGKDGLFLFKNLGNK